jgi:predicted nucleotidyltransferase
VGDERRLNLPRDLERVLRRAVDEIVRVARPEAVILFGSWAEGTATEESDVDLVVIARTNNRWHLSSRLYLLWHQLRQAMPELPPADILAYTPKQFLDNMVVGFIPHEAANYGVVLHGELPTRRARVAG